MRPFAGAFLFLGFVVVGGVPTAFASDLPDSSVIPASPPDTSTLATPASADTTSAPASSGPITVNLRNGTARRYERVEPGRKDTVRALRSDGTYDTIPTSDIATITGEVPKVAPAASPEEEGRAGARIFHTAPLPEKKAFPLVQAGFLIRFDDPPNQDESHGNASFDVGGMVNLSPKIALGGTVGVASDFDYSRISVKARLRRWLGGGIALDFAPGIFVPKKGDLFESDPNRGDMGFVGEVAISGRDVLSLTYMIEVIEANRTSHIAGGGFPPETEIGHCFGLKAGGGIGLAGVGAMLIALFAASD